MELIVTPVTVAELIYAGRPALGWTRTESSARLTGLLQAKGIVLREQTAVMAALQLYALHGDLDFADAYLAATAIATDVSVASFDRDFQAIEGLHLIAS